MKELRARSGIDFFEAIGRGELPTPPISQTLDIWPVEWEPGRMVFQGIPGKAHYNPIGSVHGGWTATMLDSAVGCAIHSALPAGKGYTTIELKVNYIRAGIPQKRIETKASQLSWFEIIKNRDVQALTFSYFTYGYAVYIFFSWFFIYLNSARGLNLKQSSYYTMLPFIAMAACSPLGGWLSDRITKSVGKRAGRCTLAAVSMVLCAIFLVAGTQVSSVPFAVVVLAGGAGALYLSQSSFWSVSADIGGSSAGAVSGVMNMGCQIGGAISSSLTAVIATKVGWTASFLVAAVLVLAGGAAWLFVYSSGNADGILGSRTAKEVSSTSAT